jgi:putative pyruvate formate lyase activating enzyme
LEESMRAPSRKPAYLSLLKSGELDRRVRLLLGKLGQCVVCPRHCRVKRLRDQRAVCETGSWAEVASWCIHRGEEPCISGTRGSGTVFFAHCNLACIFCQNYQISQRWEAGQGVKTAPELARIYLELQASGAHNLNWVSPSHVVPQAVEALALAAREGLNIPVVYNSSGYDSADTIRLLDGIVDVYMPDMKYADEAAAGELSKAVGYVPNAQAALEEMWRQVGPLQLDGEGVAFRGMLVRHLVLPNGLSQTGEVLRFLASRLSPRVGVSLMAQYYPQHQAAEHPLLMRKLSPGEYLRALEALEALGLQEGYVQELSAPENYLPDFSSGGHPFER